MADSPLIIPNLSMYNFSSGENHSWSMQCVRQLSGQGGVDYVALEPGCESLYISSGKPFAFTSDSENPVIQKEEPEEIKGIQRYLSHILLRLN